MTGEAGMENHETTVHGNEQAHPGYGTYLAIAAVLTIITAVEVAIFYIPALGSVLVPLLLTLSAGKFALVVMFYMHLKHDSSVFTSVFVAPLSLAVLVIVALILIFKVVPTVGVG